MKLHTLALLLLLSRLNIVHLNDSVNGFTQSVALQTTCFIIQSVQQHLYHHIWMIGHVLIELNKVSYKRLFWRALYLHMLIIPDVHMVSRHNVTGKITLLFKILLMNLKHFDVLVVLAPEDLDQVA